MNKSKAELDSETQRRFEQTIFTLMSSQELYLPKGIVYPEKDLIDIAPGKESFGKRLAALFEPVGTLFLKPAVAYFLILLLIYPAYQGAFRKPQIVKEVIKEKEIVEVPKSMNEIGTTREFSLGAGAIRNAGEEKPIVVSGRDAYFTLSFFVPIEAVPNFRYDLQIRRSHGELVGEQKEIVSRDGLGNFSVVCSKQLFKNGDYVLKVFKVDRASSAVKNEYTFNFRISQPTT